MLPPEPSATGRDQGNGPGKSQRRSTRCCHASDLPGVSRRGRRRTSSTKASDAGWRIDTGRASITAASVHPSDTYRPAQVEYRSTVISCRHVVPSRADGHARPGPGLCRDRRQRSRQSRQKLTVSELRANFLGTRAQLSLTCCGTRHCDDRPGRRTRSVLPRRSSRQRDMHRPVRCANR